MNDVREVRPVYDAHKPVVVKVGITLTQIFDMVSFIIFLANWLLGKFFAFCLPTTRNPTPFFIEIQIGRGMDVCVYILG